MAWNRLGSCCSCDKCELCLRCGSGECGSITCCGITFILVINTLAHLAFRFPHHRPRLKQINEELHDIVLRHILKYFISNIREAHLFGTGFSLKF
jgi:hypothetical protein